MHTAWAADNSDALKYKKYKTLSLKPAWLKLGHYYWINEQWLSSADNEEFFISENGRSNPTNELIETISALQNENTSEFIQCKFPARVAWLNQVTPLTYKIKKCKKLDQWLSKYSFKKMNLIFVAANLNQPPSMFGHTFLSVDNIKTPTLLTRHTFNYVADTEDAPKGIRHTYNGITGKYFNTIESAPFHQRLKTYSNIEGRDLIEYELDLNEDEIKQIIRHIWEIKDHIFRYYFFNENCSFQTLSILNIAKPEIDFSLYFPRYAIPLDTIRVARNLNLITPIRTWPSSNKQISSKFKRLNRKNQNLIYNIAKKDTRHIEPKLKQLSERERYLILDTAHSYLSILISRDSIDRKFGKARLDWIQNQLFEMPNKPPSTPTTLHKASTELASGHKAKRIEYATGEDGGDKFFQLGYRSAYHDYMDPIDGYDLGNSVSIFNINYRIYEDKGGQLDRFDLLKIESRAGLYSPFSREAWSFLISRNKKIIHNEKSMINSLQYRRGMVFNTWGPMLGIYGGIAIDHGNDTRNGPAIENQLHVEFGMQSQHLSYLVNYEYGQYWSGSDSKRWKLTFEMSYSNNNQYRVVLTSGIDNSATNNSNTHLALRYFF